MLSGNGTPATSCYCTLVCSTAHSMTTADSSVCLICLSHGVCSVLCARALAVLLRLWFGRVFSANCLCVLYNAIHGIGVCQCSQSLAHYALLLLLLLLLFVCASSSLQHHSCGACSWEPHKCLSVIVSVHPCCY